ncbi:MAG: gliding motility-associated C-terminal domain-containing protein [Bacteroidetes bacterium]|nr:gliding motility-associated C-terminal domain-containing protein [Bacteroidota bacterium]
MVSGFGRLFGQIPTNCFEIESILVDACGVGTQEGLNEMVIFQVGPTALNTANLSVVWPNGTNPWTGICQNAGTAAKVLAINNTITGCGRLIEPTGGVLPAGKRVLLLASVSVDQTLHSFVNLNDTLIAIFHCANNTAGNFANVGAGIRTLTMNFSLPLGCTDAVSYDRALLPGGNGATVNYCWNGNASYVNNGCTAPFVVIGTNAGAPQTVCAGSTVALNGTASSCNHRLQWSGGTGTFSNPNSTTTTYTPGPGETGTVTLNLSQFTSCDTAFSSVAITFTNPPTYSLGPDTAFCGSFSYPLGPGIAGQTYAWSTGATTQNITATTPGTYALTLTTPAGCVVSDTVTIGVSTINGLGLPADDTICTTGNFFLFPSVVGSNYVWSNGATSNAINISSPGIYSLTLTSPTGCVGFDSFQLYNYPAVIANLGNDTTLCPGNSLILDADPLGNSPGASFDWSTGATTQTITVSTAGTYVVTITSAEFCVAIDTIQVNVNSNIAIPLGPDTTICAGASLLLDAGGSGQSYIWSTGATSQTITANTSGSYAVTVTFGLNCAGADTINLVVVPNPTVNLGNDTLFCSNLGLTLDAGPGNTYAWSTGATSQTISLSAGGTYSVTVTNAGNCSAVDTIVVANGVVPQVNLGPNVQLCPGQSITLDAGTQATSYLWSTGATSQTIAVSTSGTYWAVVTTDCGTDSSAVTINVLPVASVDAGTDDTLCAGASLPLSGAVATAGTLQWSSASGSFDNSSLLNPVYQADSNAGGPVQLILTLTDSCGSYSDTLTLEIIPRLSMTFFLPDSVCYNTQIQISYVGNADSVHWQGPGIFNTFNSNPTVYDPNGGQSGTINLTATAFGQCGTEVFPLSYYSEDTVISDFGWTPALVYPGTYVQFTNGTTPIDLPVHWHFGDSFYSVEADPMHRFYTEGTYQVELIAYGANGCNDTTVIPLIVSPVDTLIPNVFSPNGDGINDYFDIFNQHEPPTERFSLGIFDRWGHQVFSTQNPLDRWDGTVGGGGSPVPDGVYYYVIEMKFLKGKVINYAGPVTVLR